LGHSTSSRETVRYDLRRTAPFVVNSVEIVNEFPHSLWFRMIALLTRTRVAL
jgi:hypothetical protein